MVKMLRSKTTALAGLTAILMASGSFIQPVVAQVSVQQGLVNVTVQDITVEDVIEVSNNNVNITVAANIIAQVCGVTVPIAVLAEQIFAQGGFTCSVEDVENDVTTVLTATQTRGRR